MMISNFKSTSSNFEPSCICMSFQHRIPDLTARSHSASFSVQRMLAKMFIRLQDVDHAVKSTCPFFRWTVSSSVSRPEKCQHCCLGHLHLSWRIVAHRVCTTLAAMALQRLTGELASLSTVLAKSLLSELYLTCFGVPIQLFQKRFILTQVSINGGTDLWLQIPSGDP